MPTATLHAASLAHSSAPDAAAADSGFAAHEAARYAVLRRLGSAIRHQIAGALQPISMMASMVERRAQKESPDLDVLRRNCAEMSTLSRSASSECVALVGWLAPPQEEPIALGQGIAECLHLMATELSLRGFSLVNETAEHDALVARSRLRTLFPALLLALTDASMRHAQVRVQCLQEQGTVAVRLSLSPVEGDAEVLAAKGYRPITWPDVEALADAEGVECRGTAEGVQFVLPIVERRPRSDAERRWG